MKPTKFFTRKSEMTEYAKAFAKQHQLNWYIRTHLSCNHRVNEGRKAIVLIAGEQVKQRLIVCHSCKTQSSEL